MTYLTTIVHGFALLLFFTAIQAIRDYRRRKGLPYPPGPRRLPIIGNLLDIPELFSWLAYTKYSETYGDVLSFHTLGQVIVVLNTAKATRDLLDKRGAIYSDRPVMPFYKMMRWNWVLTFASGDHWRPGRRMIDRGLRPIATASYRPTIQTRTLALLSQLLETPHQWDSHVELFQGELILAVTYGYQVQGHDDKLLSASRGRITFALEKVLPGTLLLNYVSFLQHVPEWFPWLGYREIARIGRELGDQALHLPMRFVKESILNGTARPSLALENLQEVESLNLSGPDREKAEETIAGALGSMYSAGLHTVVGVMKSFFVAMILWPDVQKKAQDELDSVIGRDRLPTFEDRPMLPFIDAVCKETLRWRPVSPVGVQHAVTQDDVYEGFFIPKGATVLGNIWSILHDPTVYPEPDSFEPARFLNPDGSLRDDPVLGAVFGFGKRICPGRHIADTTLFIAIASLLSVFNIERGRNGGDKLSDYAFKGGVLSYPNPFPCSFIPRDRKARELILTGAMAS